MHGTYIGDGRMLVQTVYGARLIVPSGDLSMTPLLVVTGSHELPLTQYIMRTVRAGNVVVEAGAHVGYFTVLLALAVGAQGRIVAYEANPAMVSYLLDNLSINYVRDWVQVRSAAVHRAPGTLPFHVSQRFPGNSSLKGHDERYHARYRDVVEQVEVKAEALEALVGELGHIDVLKLDIEGGEYQALVGLGDHLRDASIETLIFELNRDMMQGDYEPFCALLRDLSRTGFTFLVLTPDGRPVATDLDALLSAGWCPHVLMTRTGG